MTLSEAVCVPCLWCRRILNTNRLTGSLPTELTLLTSLMQMCVHRPRLWCFPMCTLRYCCAGKLDMGL